MRTQNQVYRHILFATMVSIMCLLPMQFALAVPTGTEVILSSNTGDGYASFGVDEFGAIVRSGIKFDPLGTLTAKNTNYFTYLYIFDRAKTMRQPLLDDDAPWPYSIICPGAGQPLTLTNVMVDQIIGTDTRITRFTLPEFPDLIVELRQEACVNLLTQTYTITNTGGSSLELRLTRVADLDLKFTAGYTKNWGAEYPLGSTNPFGATILDQNKEIGVTITAPPVGDSIFEGWRIHVNQLGVAARAHAETWPNYGFNPNILWPGVNGDGLNGIWLATYPWCELNINDKPLAGNFADYTATYTPYDMAAIVQSKLDIPAGESRVYVTETIAQPGQNCCLTATCGLISGNVLIDNGSCLGSAGVPGKLVRADSGGNSYYAITDFSGGYLLNVPYGPYSANIVLNAYTSSSCTLSHGPVVISSSQPVAPGNDFYIDPNCNGDILIFGSWPPDEPFPPNFQGPPTNPCPGFPWQYCVRYMNTGTFAFKGGSKFKLKLDFPFMENPDPNGSGAVTKNDCEEAKMLDLTNVNEKKWEWKILDGVTLLPGESCEICVKVKVNLLDPLPGSWTTKAKLHGKCCNDESVKIKETLTEDTFCSIDPNDKQVSPVGCGPQHAVPAGQELTYITRFQNVGTGPAHNIVIKDKLDVNLDIESLRSLTSNHDLTRVRINTIPGNPPSYELVMTFFGIELPPAIHDPAGSMGYVIFRLTPKPGLPDGTPIENSASIYFDANPPVITNTVMNTLWDNVLEVCAESGVDEDLDDEDGD